MQAQPWRQNPFLRFSFFIVKVYLEVITKGHKFGKPRMVHYSKRLALLSYGVNAFIEVVTPTFDATIGVYKLLNRTAYVVTTSALLTCSCITICYRIDFGNWTMFYRSDWRSVVFHVRIGQSKYRFPRRTLIHHNHSICVSYSDVVEFFIVFATKRISFSIAVV